MRVFGFICSVVFLLVVQQSHAKSIEEHILVSYNRVVTELKIHGFDGPLAKEAAKFALVRQLIEDGINRDHSVSIVGMSMGGVNGEVMSDLGLELGKENSNGLVLKRVTSSDGVACYGIYGPRANVCSAVAIVLLWDKYIMEAYPDSFKQQEIEAWKVSRDLSPKIACGSAQSDEIALYNGELSQPRRKALEKANRMYSPTASSAIEKIVTDMQPLFDFVRF
ncbi:MAG: hypothetical protein HY912_10600 [Desulfomonile tiedjei]|uniref:Uncharacterized protein n=1 Tax=Desulfomonile tiedjei TaxID=2358 RepID=A0A9D6Z6A3_9BACT|nr:hypothetical protein [Desulfomonile tiedjei]